MAKKEFKSNTIIAFSGKGKAKFIDSTIKRLISTEEDGFISFWVDGDRGKAYFVDKFDLTSETPIFGKIDNTGPGKDDWVGCIVTVNTVLPIEETPYKNKFDSTIVQNLQEQGFSAVMHYYAVDFKKKFEIKPVSEFRKNKSSGNATDLIYTGGHWGYSNLFSDSNQGGTTDLTTYNEETLDNTIDSIHKEIKIPIGESFSNDNSLNGSPHFAKITRAPLTEAVRVIPKTTGQVTAFEKYLRQNFGKDRTYIFNTIFKKNYLKTEDQDYYATALYNSPILNNDPNVAGAEEPLLFNLFNYPHLNNNGEPIFKNIIVIGSITKHTFF